MFSENCPICNSKLNPVGVQVINCKSGILYGFDSWKSHYVLEFNKHMIAGGDVCLLYEQYILYDKYIITNTLINNRWSLIIYFVEHYNKTVGMAPASLIIKDVTLPPSITEEKIKTYITFS